MSTLHLSDKFMVTYSRSQIYFQLYLLLESFVYTCFTSCDVIHESLESFEGKIIVTITLEVCDNDGNRDEIEVIGVFTDIDKVNKLLNLTLSVVDDFNDTNNRND